MRLLTTKAWLYSWWTYTGWSRKKRHKVCGSTICCNRIHCFDQERALKNRPKAADANTVFEQFTCHLQKKFI